MPDRRASLQLLLLGGGAVLLAGCGGGRSGSTGIEGGTVLAVLKANGLTRFNRALVETGLADTLSGEGPYTVFAPTNQAFAAADLPKDPAALKQVIAYHIVPGTFTSAFLGGVDVNYTTLQGSSMNIDGTAGLRADGANVVTPDLGASNGVVNIIDRVLSPH